MRVAVPVYLNTSGAITPNHSYNTMVREEKLRAKQIMLVKPVIDEYYPEAVAST